MSELHGICYHLVEDWHLDADQARWLFGDPLDPARIMAAAGVHDRLRALFAEDMADRWPTLPNEEFQAQTPIEVMSEGGGEAMFRIQGRLDNLLDGAFS